MTQAQIIEGTTEEIATRLSESYPGQKLKVYVEPHAIDISAQIPAPPFSITSEADVDQMLLEALDAPSHPVTEESWAELSSGLSRREH